MEAVVGLLVMLLAVSHGVETKCDVRQEDGAQCYGALGGTVFLQLKDRATDKLTIYKNHAKILIWRNNKLLVNKKTDKYSFTPSDGTFRIDNLTRSDTDEYTHKIRNSDGDLLEVRTLQLSIQAPVSSARLVSECLSKGEMRVSCSSEGGDSPQYSWTLDGQTLTEDKLLSGNNETDSITLRQGVEGALFCSVKNHVSYLQKYQSISTCGFIFINCTDSNETRITGWVFAATNTLCVEPTAPPTARDTTVDPSLICGLQTAVAALLFSVVAAYFAWRKKKSQRAEGSAMPEEREDAETSV